MRARFRDDSSPCRTIVGISHVQPERFYRVAVLGSLREFSMIAMLRASKVGVLRRFRPDFRDSVVAEELNLSTMVRGE